MRLNWPRIGLFCVIELWRFPNGLSKMLLWLSISDRSENPDEEVGNCGCSCGRMSDCVQSRCISGLWNHALYCTDGGPIQRRHGMQRTNRDHSIYLQRDNKFTGDTNYICGTITGAAGSQLLTPKGNGSAGNPVTIIFDSGAMLEAPYFAPSPNGGCGGAICLYGLSYYTVNGQNTGTIENTANGSGLAYHQTSEAIEAYGCTGCTIENLTIANIYTHTSSSDTAVDQTGVRCISFNGSNITISGNTMHDVGWCLYQDYNKGDANVTIKGNIIYNIDHGWALSTQTAGGSSGPFLFYGNTVYGYAAWDTGTADAYHHDGVHCYTSETNGSPAHITMLAIYNNLFEGPVGADITSHIFLEGGTGSGSTPCADSTSGIAVFNNVALADQGIATGMFGLFSGNFTSAHGGGVFNNTLISSDSTSDGSNVCFSANSDVSGMTFENNAVSGCNQLIAIASSIGFSPNYNQYGNGGSNAFVCLTSYYATTQLSSWQSCIRRRLPIRHTAPR